MLAEAQTERALRRDKHSLGIWLEHENNHGQRAPSAVRTLRENEIHESSSTRTAGGNSPFQHLLPGNASQRALVNLFFARLNPLLPLLDENQFRKEFDSGSASPILLQAICLVVSKDGRARPHLYLNRVSPSVLSHLQFATHLYDDLKASLLRKRERDRICLIQVLALMSLHVDTGPYGVEDASMHLSQAVHHAQTIGLHLGKSRGHRQSYDRLFWCLWCLSILDAAGNGRPRHISDDDIGLKVDDILESCHPGFQIMLELSSLLGRVIQLYQPTCDLQICGLDEDFPNFESIVHRYNGWDVESSVLTSLELYYHAIAIISYRTRSTDDIEMAEPSASSLRQALSTQQVMRLLQHMPRQALLPLPIVPYAVSLALSSTYRQFRRTRSTVRRAIAQEQLECYVQALEGMCDSFQSASTMAVIGRRVLSQLQRLNSTAVRRQAAEALESHEVNIHDQPRTNMPPNSDSIVGEGASVFGATAQIDADHFSANLDAYGDFDGLFTEDGTLQAMDNVFDNFMGLDLPNEVFNASLMDDTFGMSAGR